MDNRTIEQIRKNETKLINEIKLLEQVLNEIKEYCNNPFNWKYTDHYLEKDDILQIIDKVLGEEKC